MSQVSRCLRKNDQGYAHWCVACAEMHRLPFGWSFNGNVDKPTFSPSFQHTGLKTVKDENGEWTGDWVLDQDGKPIKAVCHYILTDGIVNYCADCTHEMSGKSVPIADLPKYYTDTKTDEE